MPYAKTTWVANTTPVTAAAMNNIEAGIAGQSSALSTTPPATPADGDLWYYPADTVNGTTWQFRYNAGSASAYKWEFVGGGPIYAWDGTEVTLGNAWAILAAPQITVARSGVYVIQAGIRYVNSAAANNVFHFSSGSSADASGQESSFATAPVPGLMVNAPPASLRTMTAGSKAVTWGYGGAGAGGAAFGGRSLQLTPLRVS